MKYFIVQFFDDLNGLSLELTTKDETEAFEKAADLAMGRGEIMSNDEPNKILTTKPEVLEGLRGWGCVWNVNHEMFSVTTIEVE